MKRMKSFLLLLLALAVAASCAVPAFSEQLDSSGRQKLPLLPDNAVQTISDGLVNIPEGNYHIVSVAGGQYLNAYANVGQAGPATRVGISNADGTPEQDFRLQAIGDKQYYIRCLSNGNQYCVNAMSYETVESGNDVKLWHYNTDPSKYWCFRTAGNGNYYIVNAKNRNVVLTPDSATHRANVTVQTYRGDQLQQWRLVRIDPLPAPSSDFVNIPEGNYHIVSAAGGQYLNAYADVGLAGPATRVGISNADGTPEQDYRLQAIGNNQYYIRCLSNGNQYCVNAMSGDTVVSGNDVKLWHYNTDPSKYWCFRAAGNGNYYIVNAKNQNVVLTPDSATHRANVTVQTYRGDVLQQWRLVRIDPSPAPSPGFVNVPEGKYHIISAAGGQYLNAYANVGQAEPATRVGISNADGTPEQDYRLQAIGDKQYYIRCLSNGNQYCVNAMSGDTVVSGNDVKLWHYNTDPSKYWCFRAAGNGNYYIVNAKNQNVVLTPDSAAHRANVTVQTYRGDLLQQWRLERFDQPAVTPPATDPTPSDALPKTFHYDRGSVTVTLDQKMLEQSSIAPNKNFALMAVGLSSAAYYGDKDPGVYIANAYRSLGFTNQNISLYSYPGHPLNRGSVTGMDDHDLAFSIAGRTVGDYYLLAIVLRGTNFDITRIGDIVKDIQSVGDGDKMFGYTICDGFDDFYHDVVRGIGDFVDRHSDVTAYAKNKKLKVLVTGHSLGGAGAQLVGVGLNQKAISKLKVPSTDTFVYTFASPNVYTDQDRIGPNAVYTANIFNYANVYDPVPLLPQTRYYSIFQIYPVQRFGRTISFTRGDLPIINLGAHDYDPYVKYIQSRNGNNIGMSTASVEPAAKSVSGVVACPVDVTILDKDGNTIAYTKGDETTIEQEGAILYVSDDVKYFVLPTDAGYCLKLDATGEGTMTYALFSGQDDGTEPLAEYTDVPLTQGKQFEALIDPESGGAPLYETNEKGVYTAQVAPDGSGTEIVFGDLDGNGRVTAGDARFALRVSAQLEKATSLQRNIADADGNGRITAGDARRILRVSARLDSF